MCSKNGARSARNKPITKKALSLSNLLLVTMSEFDPCKGCTIREMLRQGCCTQLVDEEIGARRIRVGNHTVEVCANLVKGDDGYPMCGDHANRPPQCKAFFCSVALDEIAND